SLAAEIHRSLVPELSFKTREFQFFGASFASGSVGGDLVDVIATNGRWFRLRRGRVRAWSSRRGSHEYDQECAPHVAVIECEGLGTAFRYERGTQAFANIKHVR